MSTNGGIVFLKMFLVYRSRRTLIRYHNFTFFCQQHIKGHLISEGEGWNIVMAIKNSHVFWKMEGKERRKYIYMYIYKFKVNKLFLNMIENCMI